MRNHASRAKDIFMLRGEHGELTTLMVSGLDPADTYLRNLAALRAWGGPGAFTKTRARNHFKEIGLAKHLVEDLIDDAVDRGHVVTVVGFKATAHTARTPPQLVVH